MKYFLTITCLIYIPQIIFAQGPQNYTDLIHLFLSFLPLVLSLVVGLIILFFAWRTGTFILDAGNKEVRANARRFFVWSIVAVLVASTIYGILSFILSEIGLGNAPVIPQLNETAFGPETSFVTL